MISYALTIISAINVCEIWQETLIYGITSTSAEYRLDCFPALIEAKSAALASCRIFSCPTTR